jgi:hypothetical protein
MGILVIFFRSRLEYMAAWKPIQVEKEKYFLIL